MRGACHFSFSSVSIPLLISSQLCLPFSRRIFIIPVLLSFPLISLSFLTSPPSFLSPTEFSSFLASSLSLLFLFLPLSPLTFSSIISFSLRILITIVFLSFSFISLSLSKHPNPPLSIISWSGRIFILSLFLSLCVNLLFLALSFPLTPFLSISLDIFSFLRLSNYLIFRPLYLSLAQDIFSFLRLPLSLISHHHFHHLFPSLDDFLVPHYLSLVDFSSCLLHLLLCHPISLICSYLSLISLSLSSQSRSLVSLSLPTFSFFLLSRAREWWRRQAQIRPIIVPRRGESLGGAKSHRRQWPPNLRH